MAAGDTKRPYIVDGTKSSSYFGSMSFSDEFNGSGLSGRWHNRMIHWQDQATANSKQNYDVTGGNARIWVIGDEESNSHHRVLCTESHFHFRYGYFECRAKLPYGFGLWPGFWTYSVDHSNAPRHEEIDWMEAYPGGGPDNPWNGVAQTWGDAAHHPVDYEATLWGPNGNPSDKRGSYRMRYRPGFSELDLSLAYHIYAGLWEPDGVTFYFDGRQLGPKIMANDINDFHSLNIQLWVGGASGFPVPSTRKNSNHAALYDYVRVWHLANGASQVQNLLSNWGSIPAVDPATDGGTTPPPTTPPPTTPPPTNPPPPTGGTGGFNSTDATKPYGTVPVVGPFTFRDEFDTFNPSAWNTKIWYKPVSNEPNWDMSGGNLRMWPTAAFSPRELDTDGKFEQRYGYFESEMKLCRGKGVWPAFWLYAHFESPGEGGRPEIDMMEAYPGGGPSTGWGDSNLNPNNFGVTLHKANRDYSYHDVPFAKVLTNYRPAMRLDDSFHVYGVMWTKDYIQFYFDGTPLGPQWPNDYWHHLMYIIFDLWYGSASGTPDGSTPLGVGNAFEMRYCRVWALADGSTSVQTSLPAPGGGGGGSNPDPGGGTTNPPAGLGTGGPVRYIRNTINGNSVNTFNHWIEIQAYDVNNVNIALNKTVTVTGIKAAGTPRPASALVDGVFGSGDYIDCEAGQQSAMVDLGSIQTVYGLRVWHYYADGRTYNGNRTEISTDGVTWTVVGDVPYTETSAGRAIAVNTPTGGGTDPGGGTGGNPTTPTSTVYSAGDQFAIRYENGEIKYIHNGVVKRTVQNVSVTKSFYFDSSFYSVGAKLQGVSFGRLGTIDWSAITGSGKPQDNATNGATIGVNVNGQITAQNASAIIANKAITNALIDSILQSDTYVPGVSGWRLDKLGNMELNNAFFRGEIQTNLIRNLHIQQNHVTEFTSYQQFVNNNQTYNISFNMAFAGNVTIIGTVLYGESGVGGGFSVGAGNTCSFYLRIDGGFSNQFSQTNYAPKHATVSISRANLTAGSHVVDLSAAHSGTPVGDVHTLHLVILRSYK